MGGESSEHWREEKGSHPRVTLSSPAGAFEDSGRQEAGQPTAPWALGPSTPAGELRWERGRLAAEAGCPVLRIEVWKACRSAHPVPWQEKASTARAWCAAQWTYSFLLIVHSHPGSLCGLGKKQSISTRTSIHTLGMEGRDF